MRLNTFLVTNVFVTLVTYHISMKRETHRPASPEPGGRAPAPRTVRLLQLFVNSYDDLTQKETIGTPDQLSRWLRRRGFDPGPRPLRSADVARLRRVREALRAVFAFHNGGALPDPDALALLNSEGLRNRIATAFSSAGRAVVASHTVGAAGLLSSLFAAAVAGTEQGMWERLKACPECGWVFYDHSRNARGSWCTMTICGSRAKMRAYRRRRSAGQSK